MMEEAIQQVTLPIAFIVLYCLFNSHLVKGLGRGEEGCEENTELVLEDWFAWIVRELKSWNLNLIN
jgi:hypothetical protein